jgi:hypothetical protein
MALYEVIKTYYVWADNEMDAEYIAPSDISACDTEIHEIQKPSEILKNWRDAIPFGDRYDDKTCAELATPEDDKKGKGEG